MTWMKRILCWLGFHDSFAYYDGNLDYLPRFACLREGRYWARKAKP